ncbi:MAG: phenylacetate--CoA ligase family protein, partial [Alphaproteobacteria bacterium]|nr:phenylacetate--CoA ligase family protein [Alphaproteobacteria bacterium]
VYPAAIQNAIFAFRPDVTGVFRIVLPKPGPKVVPPLHLRIEHGEGVGADDLDGLGDRINDHLRETLRISAAFEWLAPGSLPREAHKSRLVELIEAD